MVACCRLRFSKFNACANSLVNGTIKYMKQEAHRACNWAMELNWLKAFSCLAEKLAEKALLRSFGKQHCMLRTRVRCASHGVWECSQ